MGPSGSCVSPGRSPTWPAMERVREEHLDEAAWFRPADMRLAAARGRADVLGVGASGPVAGADTGSPTATGPADRVWRARCPCREPTNATPGRCWRASTASGRSGFGALLGGTGAAWRSFARRRRRAARHASRRRRARTPTRERSEVRAARGVTPAVAAAIADAAERADVTLERIHGLGLRDRDHGGPAYPSRLAAIEMPPHVLYVLGDPAALDARPAVAIVGTRRATDAGRAIAARLAADLVAVGASVVSGLAVGIDGAAHAAAVHARRDDGRGHRVGPRQPAPAGPRAAWRRRSSRPAARSCPSWRRTSSRARGRSRAGTGSSAGWPTRPSSSRRRPGAARSSRRRGPSSRGATCFLVPGALGAPASAGCLAFLREFPDECPDRGRDPAAHRRPRARRPPRRTRCVDRARPRRSPTSARRRAASGASSSLGRATVDELVAATGWPVATSSRR